MSPPIGPRGTSSKDTIGFRESPGGAALDLGRPRYALNVALVGACLFLPVPIMLFASSVAAGNGNAGGALGMQMGAALFIALGAFVIGAVVLQSGRWLVTVDEAAIHLVRTHRRARNLPWSSVKRIQYGPTAVRLGRYGARLGDAIRIDSHRRLASFLVDTVRFRVPADDMDRMAAVLKDIAGRHGVTVEAFPMAGRESR